MLTSHVNSPVTLARLQDTPCWPHLDSYTSWLSERRYTSSVIQLYLFGIIPLGRWMADNQLMPADFNYDALVRFRNHRSAIHQWRHRDGKIKAAYRGAQRFHEYLAVNEITAGAPDPKLLVRPLQQDFERWMSTHRGVRNITIRCYAPYVSALLDQIGEDPADYNAKVLRRFILDAGKRTESSQPDSRRNTDCSTRVPAFSCCNRTVQQHIARGTASVGRLAPRCIAHGYNVGRSAVLDRFLCVECPLTARRDRAALMLMRSLALRAGDIANLDLIDIDWGEARIRFSGKTKREIWLPLTQDVGDALIDYLQNERPDIDCTRVFVKSIAPSGPIDSSTVSWIVRRAIERTGIKAAASGAHLIRRSAATDMLRQGASLAQIGSILRHENLQTTQLYAKVDQDLLLGVVASWPSRVDSAAAPAASSSITTDISEDESC